MAARDAVVIVDGVRTPFCRVRSRRPGRFETMGAPELARIAVAELLRRTNLAGDEVDEIILGCAAAPPEAPNVARVAALQAGLPQRVPAVTVQRNCGSGMEAVTTAADRIRAGTAQVVVAGGAESMSRVPFYFSRSAQAWFTELHRTPSRAARLGKWLQLKARHVSPISGLQLGLRDPICDLTMIATADKLAREYGLSREQLDGYALRSHQRAAAARAAGHLAAETTTVYTPPDFDLVVEHDDGIRSDTNLAELAQLRPPFDREFGRHTAGNAAQIGDGACVLLVMRASRAKALGYEPLAVVRAHAYAGCEPDRMGLGPAFALPAALDRAKIGLEELDLIELNEAFAGVVLAARDALASREFAAARLGRSAPVGEIPEDRLNVNGGAIAFGHPTGATGARLILTLLREMERRGAALGAASLCIGGGQGGAVVLERG